MGRKDPRVDAYIEKAADVSPSARREYLEWITEAKTEETRQRRLDQAIAWMAEGKSRNWKYEPTKPADG